MDLVVVYNDFRGGLNTDAAPDNILDNELMVADNVSLDKRGGLIKRKGTVPLNATSYGAQVEQLIEWKRNDGTTVLLAVIGTTLAKISDVDGTKTDIQVLNRNQIGWFAFQDKFYFVDGAEYRVYDGNTVAAVTPASGSDLTPIKRCKWLVHHPKSLRFFAAGDANDKAALYYSEPNDPTYFKATSKLYPAKAEGPITGLAVFGTAVVVFYQNGAWVWKGVDPAIDAVWEPLPIRQGTLSHKSIALTPNGLTFLGLGGIYTVTAGILDYNITLLAGSDLVKNISNNKVTNLIKDIVHPDTTVAVFDPYAELYMLAYGDDVTNPRNNKILVFDWNLGAFTVWTGLQANDFCLRGNGDLLIASNNYILKANTGYKDWDVATGTYKAINFKATTKQYSFGAPFNMKYLIKFLLAAKQYTSEVSSIDITITADYKYYNLTVGLDESFIWGEPWGNPWGWTDLITKETKVKAKGHRFQVEFTNCAIDEPLDIYGFAFMYELDEPRGVRI